MKALLSIFITLLVARANAQNLSELQQALHSSNKAVQAIHGYPPSAYEGKCHWVPVTEITIKGNQLKIVERWHGPMGTSTTTLNAVLKAGQASGEWSSSFSSGNWSYDFNKSNGQWNKPESMVKSFDEMYPLKFRIVDKSALRDGPYECN